MGLQILAVRRDDEGLLAGRPDPSNLQQGDVLVMYGSDHAHDELEASV
jgi:uncharacterized protein with PhoU and TrkA domain